ncbi:MAG: hypothetical protein DHS20C05_20140 [Hyphococcus sp.]|nr:MAG: hypothetical protein DHS20C05_20140 [Marinicaulis sp.]
MSEASAIDLNETVSNDIAHDGSASIGKNADTPNSSIARVSNRLDNVTADQFLTEFTSAVCEELNLEYFLIGRLNPYSNIMRTLHFIAKGEFLDNLTYSLDGTPCANTLSDGVCIHKDNVIEEYPHDKDLIELNIRSYAGAALRNSNGDKLGVMVAMGQNPIADEKPIIELLSYFRQRVASVIEVTERLERYSWAIANSFDGVWEWDLRTGGTIISETVQKILGNRKGGGPHDLAQIEEAIHPDDKPTHTSALQSHLNDGAPYDVRLRLRDNTGVYRWYKSRRRAIRSENGKPIRMIGGFFDIHDIMLEVENSK